MYHPDAMLTVAHTREAELIREAEACGVPQAEGRTLWLTGSMLIVTALAILATAFWVFAG
ncbi:MAG: hypothetical protein ACT4QE_01750 [Anaerolineales bacterium]